MSRVILLLLLLFCVGCGPASTGFNPFKEPSMRFELLEDNGWSPFFTETREMWKPHMGTHLPLQEYFPSKYIRTYTWPKDNFFYATYLLDGGEELALWVSLPSCFTRNNAGKNSNRPNLLWIAIATNTPHVSFNSDSAYLLINRHKIVGTEISYRRATPSKDMPAYEHGVYDLASAETVATRQYREELVPRERMPFPTFYFRFPVSCREFEDAVFVIDGFTTRDGKRLPPLKVRMNYYDFDEVPALQGEQALMRK